MKLSLVHPFILLVLASFTACKSAPTPADTPKQPTDNIATAQETSTKPLTEDQLETFAHDNFAFALDLYKTLASGDNTDQNLLISPYSISTILAVTYAGARENTATQIARTAHFTRSQNHIHQAFGELQHKIRNPSDGFEDEEDAEDFEPEEPLFSLNTINVPWLAKGHKFESTYLQTLEKFYHTTPQQLDFATDPEAAQQHINRWAYDHTNGRIQHLVPDDLIDENTKLLLTNAITFGARWNTPFDEDATQTSVFHRLDNSKIDVQMMQAEEEMPYKKLNGHQVVRLRYRADHLSMILILPHTDLKSFENELTPKMLEELSADLNYRDGKLSLPKFTYSSESDLKPALQKLGITNAFAPEQANFSGINGHKCTDVALPDNACVFITGILHKTFISTDEEGTEASAVTLTSFGGIGSKSRSEPFEMILDRPFFYLIYDSNTETVLFMGRVTDPS